MGKKFSQYGIILAIVALVIGAGAGWWLGNIQGYEKGYEQAGVDAKKVEEKAAQQALEEASKAANPFQAVNPLEGIETNPFEKVKDILNPFE